MLERAIADLQDRADGQELNARHFLAIDERPVGRVQIGNVEFVVLQRDQAVRPGNLRIGQDDIRRRRSADAQAKRTNDMAAVDGAVGKLKTM